MILEQKYRAGFVMYPSHIFAVNEPVFDFKICQSCGRSFVREVKLLRVHRHTDDCYDGITYFRSTRFDRLVCKIREETPDPNGVLASVGEKYCVKCLHVPEYVPTLPRPSELEEEIKENKLKWRRRGADHSERPARQLKGLKPRIVWLDMVAIVRPELQRLGKMSSREIGRVIHYTGSGAVAVQNLERAGLKLTVAGYVKEEGYVVREYRLEGTN